MSDSLKKKRILFHANLNANHDGSFCQYKLTPTEAEVLYLITTEFLTVSQIALRRKTTRKAVEKIRSKIVKKGYLKIGGSHRGGVYPTMRTISYRKELNDISHTVIAEKDIVKIRLHALQWKVGILWGETESKVIPELMGCHVVVGDGFVELYAKEGLVFEASSEWDCMSEALRYFERVGLRLENDLGVRLIKPRSQNWVLVKSEWASENSEVAKRHTGDARPLKVFATEDGHLWLWGDWSKSSPEHETGAKVDSVEVNKHLNDWRDFHPPTNSQLLGMIHKLTELHVQTAELQKEQAAGLAGVIKLMAPPSDIPVNNVRPDYFG